MSLVNKVKTTISDVVVNKNVLPSADMQEQIAARAYFKAEARGFSPGGELDDWLAAEAETNASTKVH